MNLQTKGTVPHTEKRRAEDMTLERWMREVMIPAQHKELTEAHNENARLREELEWAKELIKKIGREISIPDYDIPASWQEEMHAAWRKED